MDIFIASDHAGFNLKAEIIDYLKQQAEIKLTDRGTYSKESCDYPNFSLKVVNDVLRFKDAYGILICGTGIGMSIAANRYKKIRAALCVTEEMASLARRHNNANILVLGARIITKENALKFTDIFLNTRFEGARHARRLDLIDKQGE